MKIVSAEFKSSASSFDDCPTGDLPEIAFVGRSNVGKSSLLNMLVNRKSLAKTSKSPGRTQLINFFLINKSFYFVDLPGYGFAKVPESVKKRWKNMIESYLKYRDQLCGIIMLVDVRHSPSELDQQMYDWLCYYNLPVAVAATKTDKLSKNQIIKQLTQIKKVLDLQTRHFLVPVSSKTKAGREELLKIIKNWVKK